MSDFEPRGKLMACGVILLCLFLGATLSCAAEKFPSRVAPLERCGGTLLVLGLALLGGLLHSMSAMTPMKIETKTASYFDTVAPGGAFTAAAPEASPAATSW